VTTRRASIFLLFLPVVFRRHSHSGIFAQDPGGNRASAHGYVAAVALQTRRKLNLVVAASREKKRKEQEKKFFQIAKNKLTAEVCIPPYYAGFLYISVDSRYPRPRTT
jgi:hypothetical protein